MVGRRGADLERGLLPSSPAEGVFRWLPAAVPVRFGRRQGRLSGHRARAQHAPRISRPGRAARGLADHLSVQEMCRFPVCSEHLGPRRGPRVRVGNRAAAPWLVIGLLYRLLPEDRCEKWHPPKDHAARRSGTDIELRRSPIRRWASGRSGDAGAEDRAPSRRARSLPVGRLHSTSSFLPAVADSCQSSAWEPRRGSRPGNPRGHGQPSARRTSARGRPSAMNCSVGMFRENSIKRRSAVGSRWSTPQPPR